MKTGIAAGSISGETKTVMPFPAAWIMNRISRCSRSLFIAGWIFFFLSASGTADAADRSRSLELLQKAEQVLGRGDTALALSVLKEVIRADRKCPDARHRLAQLYLDKGDLESRIQAGFEIDEAIRLNPKRIDYLHTRVRLCMAAGTPGAAQRVLKKILELDPGNAEAFYWLAFIHEKDWFHFYNMTSPQYGALTGEYLGNFYLGDAARSDLVMALHYYLKAWDLNPRAPDALYRLAFLHYELDSIPRMIPLLEKASEIDPGRADVHLFLGLAYHRLRKNEKALEAYERAKALMTPEQLAVFDAVDMISTPEFASRYRQADRLERERLRRAFWTQRDPLLLTEVNERILEHYGRFAYANLRFSRVTEGVQGWKTEAGQVVLRYGKPQSSDKTRPDLLCQSVETWHYPDFDIVFFDQSLQDKFRIRDPDAFRELTQDIPDEYDPFTPGEKIPLSVTYACFRGDEGKNTLEFYESIHSKVAGHVRYWRNPGVTRGIFLFDENWNEKARVVESGPEMSHPAGSVLLVGWNRLEVPPGLYTAVVEFMDRETNAVGRWKSQIRMDDYTVPDLALSDVVLAREIGDPDKNGLIRGGVSILPNTLETYTTGSNIPVYFEVYHLTFGQDGTTHYRVRTTVEAVREEKKGMDALFNKIRNRGSYGRVVTSYDYQGNKSDEILFQTLALASAASTTYLLRVDVEDLYTGQKAYREKRFTLMDAIQM